MAEQEDKPVRRARERARRVDSTPSLVAAIDMLREFARRPPVRRPALDRGKAAGRGRGPRGVGAAARAAQRGAQPRLGRAPGLAGGRGGRAAAGATSRSGHLHRPRRLLLVGARGGRRRRDASCCARSARRSSRRRAARRGEVVKRLGDGLMAVFERPAAGRRGGARGARAGSRRSRSDGYQPQLRAGIHLGRPRKLGGDYLGVDVNIAARRGRGGVGRARSSCRSRRVPDARGRRLRGRPAQAPEGRGRAQGSARLRDQGNSLPARMSEPAVLTERRDGVLVITLNRPDARNAVNAALAEGVAAALDELDADDELARRRPHRRGQGLLRRAWTSRRSSRARARTSSGRGFAGITQRAARKPLIAAIEGFAVAGGFEVALVVRPDRRRARAPGSASPRSSARSSPPPARCCGCPRGCPTTWRWSWR